MDQLDELERQLPNLIAVVNRELRGLADAGCPHVQLDVPTFSTLIGMGALTAEESADIITRCFEGVDGARRGIHICSGNMRGRPLLGNLSCAPWAEILAHLDGVIDIAHLAVHYFNRYLEREAFADMPASIELAAGILDEGCYWIEPVDKLRAARPTGRRSWGRSVCGLRPRADSGVTPLGTSPC